LDGRDLWVVTWFAVFFNTRIVYRPFVFSAFYLPVSDIGLTAGVSFRFFSCPYEPAWFFFFIFEPEGMSIAFFSKVSFLSGAHCVAYAFSLTFLGVFCWLTRL